MARAGRVVRSEGVGREMATPPARRQRMNELLHLGVVDEMDIVDAVGIHSLEGIEFFGVVVSFGFHVVTFCFASFVFLWHKNKLYGTLRYIIISR